MKGGCWDMGLYRQIQNLGHDRMVVAPSLVPTKSVTRQSQRPIDAP